MSWFLGETELFRDSSIRWFPGFISVSNLFMLACWVPCHVCRITWFLVLCRHKDNWRIDGRGLLKNSDSLGTLDT